ncbi:hypothetical protein CLG96_04050 [Sphingomonas oleivorans]|uniref:Gluconolactonase n=1 Tax=Sphingomonas oleivorans TaxID=1735121 RepID=A0A2T5G2B7_9SPHN|nr:L-dopachrome tautomerase-related protein [Sphingomonas oleivorans]PTQ13292.1 hypothetical protein CLG96_04050 [Sphingomonas oleivorans]
MRPPVLSLVALAALSVPAALPAAAPLLVPALKLNIINNGVTTTASGRIFIPVQRQDPAKGIEVGEVVKGTPRPFPDAAWNDWAPGKDGSNAFVGVNSIRIGPDGDLWVVDKGANGNGGGDPSLQPKIVRIDVKTRQIKRIYRLGAVATGNSFVNDLRFKGSTAYLTDAGQPGLIVLDLDSGAARRVLDGHPTTAAHRSWLSSGKPLVTPEGKEIVVNADQLELSPDAKWLYYQPASGPMSRIETRYLDDAALSPAELASHVEPFAATESTGGTAMAVDGTIYASDINHQRLLKIAPDGKISTILHDPRLIQMDAMWIDEQGYLWIPATQINRTAGLNRGVDAVKPPIVTYKLKLGVKPVHR